jgi:hypothetical protein
MLHVTLLSVHTFSMKRREEREAEGKGRERKKTHSAHCFPRLWLSHHAEVALSKPIPKAKAPGEGERRGR